MQSVIRIGSRESLLAVRQAEIIQMCIRDRIYTGHCTGDNGYRILSRELGGMVHQLCVGLEMEF